MKTNTINSLFLITLTMAEITRFKFAGKGFSLTNPAIERNARKQFADLAGISPKSSAKVFLSELKRVHNENDMGEKFAETLRRFQLDANDF